MCLVLGDILGRFANFRQQEVSDQRCRPSPTFVYKWLKVLDKDGKITENWDNYVKG